MSISYTYAIKECEKKPVCTTVSQHEECSECIVITRSGLHSPDPISEVIRCRMHR